MVRIKGVMTMTNRRGLIILLIVLAFGAAAVTLGEQVLISTFSPDVKTAEAGGWEVEYEPGEYTTIRDQKGVVVNKISRMVFVGDEFITEDNLHYRVNKVEGFEAEAVLLGKEEIAWQVDTGAEHVSGSDMPVQQQKNLNELIAVYHTHSDESYIPTDGSESIPGEGGIFKVGSVFSEKLRSLGVQVIHDERSHEPHDANAYLRSRRTAVKLLRKNPAAIVDVHRDGVPDPDFYRDEISGMEVSKIRIVVGRQNQNMQANLDFAKRVKGYLDDKYPGLVRGIFLAKGNYNQDLSPRTILIEAGTHTVSRERAQKGAALFAEAIPPVLGITGAGTPFQQRGAGTPGDLGATLFVITAIILGFAAYLVISTGSVEGAVKKVKQFVTVEWANFLGRRRTGRGDDNEK